MSRSGQLRVSRTKGIPEPNHYIQALYGEFADWSYDEEKAPTFKGRWRQAAFGAPDDFPLDVEIGTGNGLHFAHHAATYSERCILGFELRYKPLIQSIRRARRAGAVNARIARYNALLLPELFEPSEVNDVFIFFPDPWEKSRQHKHRLIQDRFLEQLFEMQRPGSNLFFKTDSRNYFDWAMDRFARSSFEMVEHTCDLHASPLAEKNFVTQFESLFIRQGIPIGYARLRKTT